MAQKIIKVGSSIGVVFPKSLVKELDLKPGQEVLADTAGIDKIVIRRKSNSRDKQRKDLVQWAAAYVERYRKDFEALADK